MPGAQNCILRFKLGLHVIGLELRVRTHVEISPASVRSTVFSKDSCVQKIIPVGLLLFFIQLRLTTVTGHNVITRYGNKIHVR